MSSWLTNVEPKTENHDFRIPTLDDFNFKGEPVEIQDIAAFVVKFGTQFSVFTVDFKKELLILVKTVDGVVIKNSPFLYEAQYKNAVQLLCIPFDELDKVEKAIAAKVSHVKNMFLYNTGRCGSTLLSKALENISTLQAISEPDVYTALAIATEERQFRAFFPEAKLPSRVKLVEVARISTMLLNNYFLSRNLCEESPFICYKFRARVIYGAELLQEAVPAAKNIYLYRNCFTFSESYTRIVLQGRYWLYRFLSAFKLDSLFLKRTFGSKEKTKPYFEISLGNSPEYSNAPFRHGFYWSFGYFWWSNIEKAVSLTKKDPTNFFHAILRYEDLTKQKEELVWKVAKVLRVSGSDEEKELSAISQAFKYSSQAGAGFESRRNVEDTSDVWFGEWEKTQLNAVLEYIGTDVKNGDFVIPGTM